MFVENRPDGRAPGCRTNDRADKFDIIDIPAQQGGHGDVGPHLDDFDFQCLLGVEPAILGHKGDEKSQGMCGDGDAGFFVSSGRSKMNSVPAGLDAMKTAPM